MTLSDRLERAKTQRLIEAGVLSSEHALKPEQPADEPDTLPDVQTGLFAPITIEVAPTGLHAVAEAPRDLASTSAVSGNATCPNCNSAAHLDMVDLVGHTMHYTCENCNAMWQVRQPTDDTVTR